ncbi:hypothetical protein [Halosegnis sp.]|uniref:hypothetical protein n=1 Tax=Halosegnis sp. TaxID=2864959 RepID=UPI0035D45828
MLNRLRAWLAGLFGSSADTDTDAASDAGDDATTCTVCGTSLTADQTACPLCGTRRESTSDPQEEPSTGAGTAETRSGDVTDDAADRLSELRDDDT